MSSSTPNIGLTLPIGTEKVSRQIINTNMTKIDTAIGNINRATMRPVPFTIAVADWSGSGSSYSATFNTTYVTTTSQEILTYTASLRTAKAEDLEANKKSGGGGIVFTSKKKPVGQIEGTIYVWDTDDGKIPVIIEGTVTPIANGGTGASNVTGAKNNLGITAVENSVATLNSKTVTNEVSSFLTIDSTKITIDASSNCHKTGNIVCVSLDITAKNEVSGAVYIGTIDESIRPRKNVYGVLCDYTNKTTVSAFAIQSDGRVIVYSLYSGHEFLGSVCYMV